MILLTGTAEKLEVVTAAAVTTALVFVASFVDVTVSTMAANDPGSSIGTFNNSDTTVVASPAAGDVRKINYLNLYNADNIAHTVTIQIDVSATNRILRKVVLEVGWSVTYVDGQGWMVFDEYGQPRLGGGSISRGDDFLSTLRSIDLANITTVTAWATNTSYAFCVGVSPKTSSSININYRVGTAAVGAATWGEVGIFKGDLNLNGSATLTRLGFTDVSGVVNSTGIKNTNVALSTAVQPGDKVWLAFGGQFATTQWQSRGGLANDIQDGSYQSIAGRISTIASPTAWTLAGATLVPPWATCKIN